MTKFFTLIIAGGVSGALYSLIAAGLVVSYTATGIFNLSYGAVAFTCALLYYELHTGLGWPIAAAAFITIGVFAPLLGMALDRVIFRNLTKASESSKVMATVGILIALPALAQWIVDVLVSTAHLHIPTGNQVYLAPGVGPTPPKVFRMGSGINLNSNQLIVLGVAAACAVALWVLMRRSPLGLRMRAVVDRPDLAGMRGIDRGRTSRSAWVIGTTLAGLVGVVGSPIFNSLDSNTYTKIMFVAMAAAVVGGLRSVPLAFAGGILLGIAENLVSGYATFASDIQGFNESVPFVVLLVGLFVLGRERGRRAGTVAEEVPPRDFGTTRTALRRAAPMVIGLGLVLVYVEGVASSYYVTLVTEGLALAVVFLSITVVTGLGGVVSLAQAAFVTGSGLVSGLLMDRLGFPWLVALLGGMAVAALLGIVVAIPALRLGGLSFALASLALGFVGDQVLYSWSTLENGQNGWTIAVPFGLSDQKKMAVVLVGVVVLVVLAVRSLTNSATGRAILAARTSEAAAAASGVSVPTTKLWVFGISAALAGLGGFLLSSVHGSITNTAFTTPVGLVWIATVVLWGVRRSGAAIIAGLSAVVFPGFLISGFHLWSWVPSWFAWSGTKNPWVPQILFGMGAMQMARDPDGVLALFGGRQRKRGDLGTPGRPAADATLLVDRSLEEDRGSAEIVLAMEGVSAGYGEVGVLRDISLALRRGTVTALVGANGAGKSTLASMLSGAVPVERGVLRCDGQDVSQEPAFRRARRGIVIAPEARGIFPGLSVEENLSIRLPRPEDRAEAYREFPALDTRRKVAAGALSGGEQQMLALASILIDPPKVLVADEPTLGLAPLVVEQVLGIIRRLRDQGVAVLLIEEKARAVLDVADYVAYLELGRLVWSGARDNVDEEQLASAFLGQEGAKAIVEADAAVR